MAEAPNSK